MQCQPLLTLCASNLASFGALCMWTHLTGRDKLNFLQELASQKDQPALRTNRDAFEPQLDFVPAPALAAAFEQSDVFAHTRRTLDVPFDKTKSHPGALMKSKCAAAAPLATVCSTQTQQMLDNEHCVQRNDPPCVRKGTRCAHV